MFNNHTLLLALFLSASVLQGRAESATFHGKTTLNNAVYDTLTINGHFDCDTLTAQEVTAHGKTIGKNITAESMTTHGKTEIEKSKITSLISHGHTILSNVNIQTLTCHGKLNLADSTIAHLKSSGYCTLHNTKITKTCSLTTQKAIIEDSTISCSITIKKSHSHSSQFSWLFSWFSDSCQSDKEEVLIIEGNTKITGDIIFESGKGKVYLYGKATVEGKIIGATESIHYHDWIV